VVARSARENGEAPLAERRFQGTRLASGSGPGHCHRIRLSFGVYEGGSSPDEDVEALRSAIYRRRETSRPGTHHDDVPDDSRVQLGIEARRLGE
jgi:hypothetical protein